MIPAHRSTAVAPKAEAADLDFRVRCTVTADP
jgi:hypothetical protein